MVFDSDADENDLGKIFPIPEQRLEDEQPSPCTMAAKSLERGFVLAAGRARSSAARQSKDAGQSARGRGPGAVAPLRDVHVLVVDDNRDAREMLRGMLSYAGALVRAVSSGPRALVVMRTIKFDIIVSDLAMPRYDGCWLIRRVRRMSGARARIPAIAVTAYRDSQTPTDAARAGFNAYMEKPLEFRRLVETIQKLMGRTASG